MTKWKPAKVQDPRSGFIKQYCIGRHPYFGKRSSVLGTVYIDLFSTGLVMTRTVGERDNYTFKPNYVKGPYGESQDLPRFAS